MIYPEKDEFLKLAKKKSIIPIYKELIADIETPVSIYSKFIDYDYSFLLESVEKEKQVGRYSFIGIQPEQIIQSDNLFNTKIITGLKEQIIKNKNPINYIDEEINKYEYITHNELPPFTGGFIGNFNYEIMRLFEDLSFNKPDEINIPEINLMLVNKVIVFDHYKNKILIIINVKIDELEEAEMKYNEGIDELNLLQNKILFQKKPSFLETQSLNKIKSINNFKYNYSKEEFIKIVEKTKEYIKNGDIVQAVLSLRIGGEVNTPILNIYRALRIINPSPYMFFIRMKDTYFVGASPETMVKVQKQELTLRPIAGTRPIGKNKEEDEMIKKELLSDEKELAEHTMLLDLGRNDANRICIPETVNVPEKMLIEKYSHVMHIVSTVKGRLKEKASVFDILKATFPAGTVTGAPKIRAMQIIEELENIKRSFYSGGIGYISYSGDLDLAIAIRTMLIKNKKFYIQAGAGIVYDSIPAREYEECMNKAKSLFSAIKFAQEGLR
ncbi:MAG TPA: anthranilate synthase component I [bacterium]|nr:anthranilate synthase component I [bacterium]HOL46717.1 anthranilate synthase component I [bacterium]HPQ18153.1 anthranilate synthase component I [bacterium]